MSTGSAALSKLTLNPPKFLELLIPLPAPEVQRRIAARLDRLAVKIAQCEILQRQSSAESTALRKATLRVMSEGFGNLGSLSRVLRSKPRNGWSPRCDNADGGTSILTLSAVTGFDFTPTAIKRTSESTNPGAHYWLKDGDLLITRSNTPLLVGHAAIYAGEPKPCVYPDLMMRLEVDPREADTTFVWHWLQTPLVRDFIERNAKGTSPTMKKISQPIVMNIPFPEDVPVERQRQLVTALARSQQRMAAVSKYRSQANAGVAALLPSILDRAFRGEM